MRHRAGERPRARVPRRGRQVESARSRGGNRGVLDGLRHPDEGQIMGRLFAAIQFLTVIPAPAGGPPAPAAIFFPLVGATLGLAAGAIRLYAPLPPAIAALLALVFLVAVTGALHEDGLADVADAFRAGRSPERILAILKDSRIGVYGA